MAAKIENGNYVFENNGKLIEISGNEEILQRAFFRIKAHKGEFELDKTLGSEIYKLDLNAVTNDVLFMHIAEAVMPIEEVEVTAVEKATEQEGFRIMVYLNVNDEAAILELFYPQKP